ncbi:MAG: NAD(P)-dependent oxidoreductase [Dehalococcoidia bacterium]|nr:NAD(P)-dependent oxidoreductase [Dehalococcoidia bacterium]
MILITGGMGFIGLHTARQFVDVGEEVVITRYSSWREPSFIKDEYGKRVQIERVDTTSPHDINDVVRKHKVTGIIHLVVPGLGALTPAEDNRINTLSLINVLEAARINDVKRVLLASSIGAYGSLPEGPFKEEMPLPMTSGSATEAFKKAWEILALHYADRTKMDVISVRINVNCGPLYHSMSQPNSRMAQAAARGLPVNFTGAAGGQPFENDETDLNYIKDCGLGLQLLQMAPKLNHRIYNLGHGRGVTAKETLAAIKKVAPSAQIELQPGSRPGGRKNAYMDISRITADTGFKPRYEMDQAMPEYIEWLKSNPN